MQKLRRYLFKYYYIGKSKFHGSQRQDNVLTIEDVIINVFKKIGYISNLKDADFESASRTDKNVSARGAVFGINIAKRPILMELNSFLNKEIGIWGYKEVTKDFSPRYRANKRHYKYIISKKLRFLEKEYNFDINIVKKACTELIGTHDFQNFSKLNKKSHKTIRTIDNIELNIYDDCIIIDFISKGFLRQQIRRTITKLMELGMGEISYQDFLKLFDSSNIISYQSANPRGLILWDIEYGEEINFIIDEKSIERMNNYFLNQKQKKWLKYQLFSVLQQDDFR